MIGRSLTVTESELDPDHRCQAGQLLHRQWPEYDPQTAIFAMTPEARVLQLHDDRVIGCQSVFRLCLLGHAGVRAYGLGALVVDRQHRGIGIARLLIGEAAGYCEGHGAVAALTATRVPAVQRIIDGLGFRPVEAGQVVWPGEHAEETKDNFYRRDWPRRLPEMLILAEGRF